MNRVILPQRLQEFLGTGEKVVIPAQAGIQALNLFSRNVLKTWIPALAGMTTIVKLIPIILVLVLVLGAAACKKKDRFTASTYSFTIVPPTAVVVLNQSKDFTAVGQSSAGRIEVNPEWQISGGNADDLSSNLGPTVTLSPTKLDDVILIATYDGMQAQAQVNVVSYIPGDTALDIYSDNGIPTGSDIDGDISFNPPTINMSSSTVGYTPEGLEYFHTTALGNGEGWSITFDFFNLNKSRDLSLYSGGRLKFSIRLAALTATNPIRIGVADHNPAVFVTIDGNHGFLNNSLDWQDISINLNSFAVTFSQIEVPFAIYMNPNGDGLTFDIDAVRWEL